MLMVLGLPRIATGPDPSDDRHHEQLMIVTLVDHETADARYHGLLMIVTYGVRHESTWSGLPEIAPHSIVSI